jgi:alpha-D-ribose 1-methylphosphonate 5-triphosphate synthase subunit PhnG
MSLLARAETNFLETAWDDVEPQPAYRFLRVPECGLAMVRGRTGGTGVPFNLGEMTMTRCAVSLADGETGFGYVAGRSKRHAELAAVFDALLQDPARRGRLELCLLNPIARRQDELRRKQAAAVAATKVDFFTLVRGEDDDSE